MWVRSLAASNGNNKRTCRLVVRSRGALLTHVRLRPRVQQAQPRTARCRLWSSHVPASLQAPDPLAGFQAGKPAKVDRLPILPPHRIGRSSGVAVPFDAKEVQPSSSLSLSAILVRSGSPAKASRAAGCLANGAHRPSCADGCRTSARTADAASEELALPFNWKPLSFAAAGWRCLDRAIAAGDARLLDPAYPASMATVLREESSADILRRRRTSPRRQRLTFLPSLTSFIHPAGPGQPQLGSPSS
jgi:hypothetical protein